LAGKIGERGKGNGIHVYFGPSLEPYFYFIAVGIADEGIG